MSFEVAENAAMSGLFKGQKQYQNTSELLQNNFQQVQKAAFFNMKTVKIKILRIFVMKGHLRDPIIERKE